MIVRTSTIRAKVFPEAKKDLLVDLGDDAFAVYVRAPAQRNLANRCVRELLAEHFAVPVANVTIEAGHRTRNKRLTISYRN